MADQIDTTGAAQTVTLDVSGATGDSQGAAQTVTLGEQKVTTPYTDEELSAIVEKGEDFDRNRLTPAQRAIQQTFEKGYTPKFEEAAALKRQAEEIINKAKETPEVHFEDANKNKVFTDYLANPMKIVNDINATIAQLEGTDMFDDDGKISQAYRDARRSIAYWNGIKDEFSLKRQEIVEKRQSLKELGNEAPVLEAYAKTMGFSESDFRSKPELRKNIKKLYDLAQAGTTATTKEVKTTPVRLASQSGGGGGAFTGIKDEWDPNLTTEERIALGKQRRAREAGAT